MGRIQQAFERRYLELLAELGARDREKALRWFNRRAERIIRETGETLSHAHAASTIELLGKLDRYRNRREDRFRSPEAKTLQNEVPIFCDAGLGGLARWLRATGFKAHWKEGISDGELVAEATKMGAVILTTDSYLADRKPIVQGEVRCIWVPPTLTVAEQLALVRAELGLPEGDSRCMKCGGALLEVRKEEVKDRIPPRTYVWLNEFFQCRDCGQLFWNGTHWKRIQAQIGASAP